MYYNDPYTELYHYGVPGMKWGVRKAIYQGIGSSRRRSSFNGRFTPPNIGIDGIKKWGSHIRSNAYDKVKSAAGAGFKAAGLEHYRSAILIGGGIALAGAATAGGIALYKHHKKKQAEKNNSKN